MGAKRKWKAAAANVADALGLDHAEVEAHALKLHAADRAGATDTPTAPPKPAEPVSAARAESILLDGGVAPDEVRVLVNDPSPDLLKITARQQLAGVTHRPQPRGRAMYARGQDGRLTTLAEDDRAVAVERAGIGANAEPSASGRIDPERALLDQQARALAAETGIDYLAAAEQIEGHVAQIELENVDGASDTPFLDTPQPMEAKPWSDEDWQRDSRRAAAAGVEVDRDMWQANAELGRDVVHELASQKREAAVADHAAGLTTHMQAAQRRAAAEAQQAAGKRSTSRLASASAHGAPGTRWFTAPAARSPVARRPTAP